METCEVNKPRTCKVFWWIVLAIIAVVAWQGWVFFKTKKIEKERFEYAAQVELNKMVDTLSTQFHELTVAVNELSEKISETKHEEAAFEKIFVEQLNKYKNIPSFVCGFEPNAYQPKQRLFGIGWARKGDSFEKVLVEYDYTLTRDKTEIRTDWYTETIKDGARWVDPYWGTALQSHLIAYSVPVCQGDAKKVIGAVIGVCRLDDLRNSVSDLKLGASGYSFIVSTTGTYVTYPIKDYYQQNKTIFDVAKAQNNASLEAVARDILAKKDGVGHFISEITQRESTVCFKSIPDTPYILCAVFANNEGFKQ